VRIDVLTLFPEMFSPVLGASILKRAAEAERVAYHLTDIRDYTDQQARQGRRSTVRWWPGNGDGLSAAVGCVAAVEKQDKPDRRSAY
jgi:tRNA (guanine37-N1)-methyltransferase